MIFEPLWGCSMIRLFLVLVICGFPFRQMNTFGSQRQAITLQTVSSVKEIASLPIGTNKTVWDIAFSPNGHSMAVAESDQKADRIGTVRLWNGVTLKEFDAPQVNTLDAIAVDFSPDGKLLAAAGRTGEIFLVDTETSKLMKTVTVNKQGINAISFSPDGLLLAIANNTTANNPSENNNQTAFELINIETDEVVLSASSVGEDFNPGSGLAVAFSPNGKYVALGQGGNIVQIWELETKKLLHSIKDGSIGIYSIAFSPDSQLIVAGDGNGQVIQWDVETGQKQIAFEGGMQWDNDVVFSPDGSLLAVTGSDGNIRLFNVKTQEEVAQLKGHTGSLISLAFSPDGTLLASGGTDGTVRLWGVKE
jgi:WD40 repeat protein